MRNKSGISPLFSKELNEIKDEIYKEQFFDYDETINAKEVLDALQNLKSNPKLLDYVLKCLAKQNIYTIPDKFYAVVANLEKRPEYNQKIHQTFELYKKHCIDGDFGLRKHDKLLDMTFENIGEIENYMLMHDGEEIPLFGHTKFEKYSIKEISGIKQKTI